ncbi:MAG: redoxin domain-containing protein, partial [Candidatus Babeliales bacterium]
MKNNYFIFFLFIGVMLTCYAKKSVVTIGEKAPNFSLIGTDGKKHNLSEFKGKKVALYFFPKAGSFYCTKEATSLRDNFSALKKNNIT